MDPDTRFIVVGSVLLFNWLIFDARFGNRLVLNIINLALLLYVGWSVFRERVGISMHLRMNIGAIYSYALFAYLVNLIFNRWLAMYSWLFTPVNVLIVGYTFWFTYRNWSLVRLYLDLIWLRLLALLRLR
jgi:hypothetical protein